MRRLGQARRAGALDRLGVAATAREDDDGEDQGQRTHVASVSSPRLNPGSSPGACADRSRLNRRVEHVRVPEAVPSEAAEASPALAPPPLPAAVLRLQRSAGNQAVGRMLSRAPAAATAADPMPAVKAINAWREQAAAALAATNAWETANWIEFLSRTSSNPRLTLADTELADVAANALGNLLTAVGPELIRRAATRWTAGELGATVRDRRRARPRHRVRVRGRRARRVRRLVHVRDGHRQGRPRREGRRRD